MLDNGLHRFNHFGVRIVTNNHFTDLFLSYLSTTHLRRMCPSMCRLMESNSETNLSETKI